MIVYYAVGGGLGHVTRARRVLDALQLEARIVASSDIPPELERDLDAHRAWIRALGAERILADAFPLGIKGELADIGVPLDYVARLLRWDEYRRAVPHPLPRFGTTYVVEPIAHEVESDRVIQLDLLPAARGEGGRRPDEGYWLIVHSGPPEEVAELIAYAADLQRLEADLSPVLVATLCDVALPPRFTKLDAVPATPYFANATRIISAAGFNVMLETEPYREKHHILPMPRRFDDQFARAARRKREAIVSKSVEPLSISKQLF